jgi:hypothetical protein
MRYLALAPAAVLLAMLAAGSAFAQTPLPGKEVSPLVISPPANPPRITSTWPAAGDAVAPGLMVLTLTFDQRMLDTGFDVAAAPGAAALDCLKTPRLLNGGKTFGLLCKTLPGKTYAVAVNGAGKAGFASIGGKRAEAATLNFTTTSGDPVRFMDDALKAAHLGDQDVPVEVSPGFGPSG